MESQGWGREGKFRKDNEIKGFLGLSFGLEGRFQEEEGGGGKNAQWAACIRLTAKVDPRAEAALLSSLRTFKEVINRQSGMSIWQMGLKDPADVITLVLSD